MELCKHCGIVHEDGNCPLCDLKDELFEANKEIQKLNSIIEEKELLINDLESQLEDTYYENK